MTNKGTGNDESRDKYRGLSASVEMTSVVVGFGRSELGAKAPRVSWGCL
jgi:hypothetical protein